VTVLAGGKIEDVPGGETASDDPLEES